MERFRLLVDRCNIRWRMCPYSNAKVAWESEGGDFVIALTNTHRYRLIAHAKTPSTMFPDATCWMWEYGTLELAAKEAEKIF